VHALGIASLRNEIDHLVLESGYKMNGNADQVGGSILLSNQPLSNNADAISRGQEETMEH
jgi:hypothetical protein